MSDTQLYLSIGVPTLAVVLGMMTNGFLYNALSARMSAIEARMLSMETKFDLLIGKVSEIDTRLSVLEDRLSRS